MTKRLLHSLGPIAPGGTLSGSIDAAARHAPYLRRLLEQNAADLNTASEKALEAELDRLLSQLKALECDPPSMDDAMIRLRQIKRRAHLTIALLDLSTAWPLMRVTGALTEVADGCVRAALATALQARQVSGEGLFVIAFGKMGAHELNYSSDIDIAAFFDPDVFTGGDRGPVDTGTRVIKDVCRLLDTQTEHGYVFRTDLRLRPDPSSTPIAVSTRRAEIYYESLGQNWERMAWIKARPCAGDFKAAASFRASMEPFIWRRHLDYWALADVHAIKRMINDKLDENDDLSAGGFDVKLGAGGIREIEFFVQTQQVILGGRDAGLRQPGTLEALNALSDAGHVDRDVEQEMASAYKVLRSVEHRIQMLHDEQTHSLPVNDARRGDVAALMGLPDVAALDEGLAQLRRRVHSVYSELFAKENADGDTGFGNLVFTGVDDDPGTLATLERLGFSNPPAIITSMRRWHYGSIPATRTRRAQELLTAITPTLLKGMSATGEPDQAFTNFIRFFEGLTSGVQILSMLQAEPDLLSDLVSTLAIAPRLAKILAARPRLLEALLSQPQQTDFAMPHRMGFEDAMDETRRLHRDQTFLIGHRLLNGRLAARDAAAAWTNLADRVVIAMADAAAKETERRFGPPSGTWCVFGMGSLGAGELTASSDLDLLVIYELADKESLDGQNWFTRFTQRLVTALSAPTAEGLLYEVDLRLRPSGRAGPVAVRLSAFEQYQMNEAWTWEHMALTRMRSIAGDVDLAERTLSVARGAIASRSGRPEIAGDIYDMRQRLLREKPGQGLWDLKQDPGGLIDIEFHVQKRLLELANSRSIQPDMEAAFELISEIRPSEAEALASLRDAWIDLTSLRQVLAIAVVETDPEQFSAGLKDRLARALQCPDFKAVQQRLQAAKDRVRQSLAHQ